MKINLGSGRKRYFGFQNIDANPDVNPDYLINLDDVNIKLPFDDDSIEEVKAEHILEHIGSGFIPLMVELYRVCKNGAIIDIIVPHHHHEVFYGDPTHVRPISISMLNSFNMDYSGGEDGKPSDSSFAVRYNVDFKVVWFDFDYDHFYHNVINGFRAKKEKGETSPEEDWLFERLMREALNVAINTKVKLQVNK